MTDDKDCLVILPTCYFLRILRIEVTQRNQDSRDDADRQPKEQRFIGILPNDYLF